MKAALITLGLSLSAALLSSGCTFGGPKQLYSWGVYQKTVYEYMRADGDVPIETQIQQLETMASEAQAKDEALPPGYRAHLGLLYARQGDTHRLQSGLEQEKQAFPESTTFADFLLRTFKGQAK
jgi:hypothetical protein